MTSVTYRDAGVDIEAGDALVEAINANGNIQVEGFAASRPDGMAPGAFLLTAHPGIEFEVALTIKHTATTRAAVGLAAVADHGILDLSQLIGFEQDQGVSLDVDFTVAARRAEPVESFIETVEIMDGDMSPSA